MEIRVVTISFKYDQKSRFVEIIFAASPDVLDYQEHFPEIVRILDQENISNVLVHTNFSKRTNDKKAFEFTKFVFADLNRHINHLAIVCPESFRPPIDKIIEPIINQGKPVKFFTSRDDAVEWLAIQ